MIASVAVRCVLALLLTLLPVHGDNIAQGSVDATEVNPIRKVVGLLQDMQKEIHEEGIKEKELFDKFMCICNGGDTEFRAAVEMGKGKVAGLESQLQEEGANRATLKQELKEHYKDKAEAEKDLGKATALREKERAEFESENGEATTSIASLGKAIPALEGGGTAALIQAAGGTSGIKKFIENSAFLTTFDRQRVLAFIDSRDGDADSPGTSQIIGILKGMKDEMEKGKAEMEQREKGAGEGFSQLKAAKDQELAASSTSIEKKERGSGELAVSISQNTDSLEDAQAELDDNTKFLSSLKTQCAARKQEWGARTQMRTDEVAAISEAIKILNDDDALEVFKKSVPSAAMMQTQQPTPSPRVAAMIRKFGFLQGRHQSYLPTLQRAQGVIATASSFLKSNHLNVLLYTLNTSIRQAQHKGQHRSSTGTLAAPDMSGIVKMVDNMIDVLVKEMVDDEEKKKFCESEIAKSDTDKAARTEELQSLDSSMEESADELGSLGDDIKALDRSIRDLDKDVAQATEQRKKEHQEYVDSVSMTDTAMQLIGKARNRMAKFYNPAIYQQPKKKELTMEEKIVASYGAAAFVQEHSLEKTMLLHKRGRRSVAPIEIPKMPAFKKSKKSGGVMELMNMLKQELKMDKQRMEMDEKVAQKDYVELMSESQESRAQDAKALVNKRGAKANIEGKMQEMKETRQLTQEDWTTVHEYLISLHGQCDLVIENYIPRVEARNAELESLRNAKSIMSGQDVGVPAGLRPEDGAAAPAEAAPAEEAAEEPVV